MIDTLPIIYLVLKGGLTLSVPDRYKNFEDIANYNSTVGSSRILRKNVFAYTYPYNASSPITEYTSDSASIFQPSFYKPTEVSLGWKMGKYYIQFDGGFWGSYVDRQGDYQVYSGRLNLSSYASFLREYTISILYNMFQRSAYIGRFPYGDTVLEFYEKWIYFDNVGFEFISRGDLYSFFSGFSYSERGIPIWSGFTKEISGFNLRIRQISFLSTTILPVRTDMNISKRFILGKYNIDNDLFVGYVFSSRSFYKGLIVEHRIRYTRFFASGEGKLNFRWFISKGGENYGFEPSVGFKFARRPRMEVFLGYFYPSDRGIFGGITIDMFRRNIIIGYYNENRSFHLGMEVDYVRFGF